jgi:hypothetical protein
MAFFPTRLSILTLAALSTCGCASSTPMQDRLNKNFVYNCSLEMMRKDVSAADAERICSSAHEAEMREAGHPPRERSPNRSPASHRAPKVEESEDSDQE